MNAPVTRSDRANRGPVRAATATRSRAAAAGLLVLGAGLLWSAGEARAETDREYCERQEGPAKTACLRDLKDTASKPAAAAPAAAPAATSAAPAVAAAAPYKVVDGTHVDANTLKGFQAWRAAACDRCHGPNQEGMVGPSLIASLKVLTKDEFKTTVTNGRLEKGMPSFSTNDQVMSNLDNLYSYLKGRSDGAITKAKVQAIDGE